ncbi:hypothetical protein MRX96_042413 [Rhipicephalus microplus]
MRNLARLRPTLSERSRGLFTREVCDNVSAQHLDRLRLRTSSGVQLSSRAQQFSGTGPLRGRTRTFNQWRGRELMRRVQTTSPASCVPYGYVAKRSVCANPWLRTRFSERAPRQGGAALAVAVPFLMLSRIGGRHKSWSTMSSTIGVLADDSGSFRNRDGHKISCVTWSPEVEPRALVFVAHGYAEHCHSPCYDVLARKLVGQGCYVFSHDHVGHGKSEGPRALVKSADTYVDDILTHVDLVKQKYPSRPVFLFGHSMGGTMCVGSALERPKQFSGMVLNAPALWLDPVQCSWTKVTVHRSR